MMGLGNTFVGLAERFGWIPPPPDIEEIAGSIRPTLTPVRSTALTDTASARTFALNRLHATEDPATGRLTLPSLPGEHWIGPIDYSTGEIVPYGLLITEILKPRPISKIVADASGLRVYLYPAVGNRCWHLRVRAATPGNAYGARIVLGILCCVTGRSAEDLGVRYHEIAQTARAVTADRCSGNNQWSVRVT